MSGAERGAEGLVEGDQVRVPKAVTVSVEAEEMEALRVKVAEEEEEGVGRGVGEKGPPTAVRVTGDASLYTLSPVCVAMRVQVPPTPRKATLPVLKVPDSAPAEYAHTVGVDTATVTAMPLEA